jgi:hypothetical protein
MIGKTESATSAATRTGNIVSRVRSYVKAAEIRTAERLVRRYFAENGNGPEALEAMSWLARGALNAHQLTMASDCAKQVLAYRFRPDNLDSGPHIATAVGASIEVLSQAMARQGRHAEAVRFLKRQLRKFAGTRITIRIRKNLNLLTFEGQPAPELDVQDWIGRKPPSLVELRRSPVLLFFWAHYCSDSRAQGRILARIRRTFEKRGLVLMGPTRLYGQLDEQGRKVAGRRRETEHLRQVLPQNYQGLAGIPVPISSHNFETYGVSTTPTLVLVDRSGIVSFYHPGRLTYKDLAVRVESILTS